MGGLISACDNECTNECTRYNIDQVHSPVANLSSGGYGITPSGKCAEYFGKLTSLTPLIRVHIRRLEMLVF